MGMLVGKRVVVFGLASEESIAWSIVQVLAAAGAEVHVGYQQRFRSRVMQLLRGHPGVIAGAHRCDVTEEAEVGAFFAAVGAPLHGMVHAVAYTPPETFGKPIFEASSSEFAQALLVSCHSLLRLTREALPLMPAGGSIVTLSYLGAQRVVPSYRLMGIAKAALEASVRELAVDVGPYKQRVNAISAGPIRTLSAAALPSFQMLYDHYPAITPLGAHTQAEDVGRTCLFLLSDLSSHITGQTLFVDGGYSILGAYPP